MQWHAAAIPFTSDIIAQRANCHKQAAATLGAAKMRHDHHSSYRSTPTAVQFTRLHFATAAEPATAVEQTAAAGVLQAGGVHAVAADRLRTGIRIALAAARDCDNDADRNSSSMAPDPVADRHVPFPAPPSSPAEEGPAAVAATGPAAAAAADEGAASPSAAVDGGLPSPTAAAAAANGGLAPPAAAAAARAQASSEFVGSLDPSAAQGLLCLAAAAPQAAAASGQHSLDVAAGSHLQQQQQGSAGNSLHASSKRGSCTVPSSQDDAGNIAEEDSDGIAGAQQQQQQNSWWPEVTLAATDDYRDLRIVECALLLMSSEPQQLIAGQLLIERVVGHCSANQVPGVTGNRVAPVLAKLVHSQLLDMLSRDGVEYVQLGRKAPGIGWFWSAMVLMPQLREHQTLVGTPPIAAGVGFWWRLLCSMLEHDPEHSSSYADMRSAFDQALMVCCALMLP